jgi:hypothetical protein
MSRFVGFVVSGLPFDVLGLFFNVFPVDAVEFIFYGLIIRHE